MARKSKVECCQTPNHFPLGVGAPQANLVARMKPIPGVCAGAVQATGVAAGGSLAGRVRDPAG